MKLFKSQKNKIPVVNKTSLKKTPSSGGSFPNQTKESQVLLRNIKNRKRGVVSPRVVFRKKHGIVKKIIFLILLLGLVTFLFFKFDVPSYFKVSHINIAGVGSFVNSEDVKNLVERNIKDQYIFSVKEKEISDILLKSFMGAKSVSVKRNYPNSVDVFVEERVPLAVVYNNDEEYFLLDSEGYVLGVVTDAFSELPKIKYEGSIVIGTFLEKEIIPVSIEILKFAEKEELKISSMSFYPNHAKLYVDKGAEVFIGYNEDYNEAVKTVKALVVAPRKDGKMLKKIDLRYDKLIVLYD